MAYLESRGNSEKKTCASYVKILIRRCDLIWPDLDLISVKSQVGWRHRVKWMSLSVSACKMAQKTCVARHVRDFYFLVTFSDLTLTFSRKPFVLIQYPLWTFTQHFEWVWALCIPSNRPGSPKCENASLWPLAWPLRGSLNQESTRPLWKTLDPLRLLGFHIKRQSAPRASEGP